jgi:Flp pilus assembly protein TadG
MTHIKSEKGQALIIITFAIIGLIGLTGLAVDGSIAYANQRKAQAAADSAAYAAALATIRGDPVDTAVNNILSANGIQVTELIRKSPPGPNCRGVTESFTNGNEYVQVIIKSKSKTSFGSIVGIKEVNNCAEAITHVIPGTPGVSAGSFGGAGVVSLALTGTNYNMSGSGKIIATNGGVFANSSSQPSVIMSGDPRICLQTGYSIGVVPSSGGTNICTWCSGGCPTGTLNTLPPVTNGVSQYTQANIDAFLATVPDPYAEGSVPTCSGNGAITGSACWSTSCAPQVVTPGNYPSGLTLDGGKYFTIQSGTYCFNGTGGFVSTGGAHFSHDPATTDVVFVGSGSNGVDMQGGTDAWRLRSLKIYTVNGNWHVGGGVNLYADQIRFISSGSGNNVIDGNSFIKNLAGTGQVPDAFMYFKTGKPSWDAGANIAMHAPSSGPFKGLLVDMPWSNTNALTFSGGTGYSLTGTYLAPHSVITITGGNASTVVNSQIIGYQFIIDGGAALNINYGAADNFSPLSPTNPKIQLVK